MAEDKAYLYWLHKMPEVGERTMEALIKKLGCGAAVYEASEKQLRTILSEKQFTSFREFTASFSVEENYRQLREKGIGMVSRFEEAYPRRLKRIQNPPILLYYLGTLPKEEKTALAIVGARECSDYGSSMAKAFGAQMAKAGICVISGMARGIDGISQKAALEAGGDTYGVLGCGVDVCYPASNRRLYLEMQKRGGILSPYPPGTQPRKVLFPSRNRIVAGLSDGVLVVEARQKSGTWITVDMALEQGKDVYAVPGRLTDRLSDGCNLLIRQGAGIALTPEDVIRELSLLKNRGGKEAVSERISRQEERCWERETVRPAGLLRFLDLTPKSSDEIFGNVKAAGIDITLPQLLFELIQLCMAGKAGQIGGNYFVRKMNEESKMKA